MGLGMRVNLPATHWSTLHAPPTTFSICARAPGSRASTRPNQTRPCAHAHPRRLDRLRAARRWGNPTQRDAGAVVGAGVAEVVE